MTTQALTAVAFSNQNKAIYEGFCSRAYPVVAYQTDSAGFFDSLATLGTVASAMEPGYPGARRFYNLDLTAGISLIRSISNSPVQPVQLQSADGLRDEIEAFNQTISELSNLPQLSREQAGKRLQLEALIEMSQASLKILDSYPNIDEGNMLIDPLLWLRTAPSGVFVLTGWEESLQGASRSLDVCSILSNFVRTLLNDQDRKCLIVLAQEDLSLPAMLSFIPKYRSEVLTSDEILRAIKPLIQSAPATLEATIKASGREPDQSLQITLTEEDYESLSKAAVGLSLTEIRSVLLAGIYGRVSSARYSSQPWPVIDSSLVKLVVDKKIEKLQALGVHFAPAPDVIPQGMPVLTQWIEQRERLFWATNSNAPQTTKLKIAPPKGILMVGPSGTGKTLGAKALARKWGIPLLTLDIASLYGSLVGESEQRLKEILRLIEVCAPCAVLIDELDKGTSGVTAGGGDSGVSQRIMGTLLTWLNDKPAGIFVVATANDPRALVKTMPEFFRAGRFDKVFFVDLPDTHGRAEILKTHLSKQEQTPDSEFLAEAAAMCEAFSGAEIASMVQGAALLSFSESDSGEITLAHLAQAANEINPLGLTSGTNIQAVRDWAQSFATNVATTTKKATPATATKKAKAAALEPSFIL